VEKAITYFSVLLLRPTTTVETESIDRQFMCTKVLASKDITFSTALSFAANEENPDNSSLR